jgi:hypothetical protein
MRRCLTIGILVALLGGCECDPPRETDSGAAPMAMPEPAPSPVDPRLEVLRSWLRASAVSHTHVARPILYTWTRDEQIEELRAGAPVLSRSESTTGVRSGLDVALDADTSEFAQLMRRPGLSRWRFAWPSPWATRMGWPETGDYGDRLLRIELRPESLIAVYDSRITPRVVRFFTDEGNDVPLAEAMLVPQFWAAIYHVQESPGPDGAPRLAREFVIINESMIARVVYGTPQIESELAVERERLNFLATQLGPEAAPFTRLSESWDALPPDDADLRRLYDSSLAFSSPLYLPTEPNVRAIVAALSAQPGPFFERQPSVTFDLDHAPGEATPTRTGPGPRLPAHGTTPPTPRAPPPTVW